MTVRDAGGDDPAIVAPTGLEFLKKYTKLYVPVVTLSSKDDNLNYLIDQIFTKVSRLFVFSFKNETDRTSILELLFTKS